MEKIAKEENQVYVVVRRSEMMENGEKTYSAYEYDNVCGVYEDHVLAEAARSSAEKLFGRPYAINIVTFHHKYDIF